MSSSRPLEARKLAFFMLRLALAAALLSWLVRSGRLDLDALLSLRPGPHEWLLFVAGAVAMTASFVVLGLRLRWLLGTIGQAVSFRRAVRVTVLGAFFGTLLPGLVGGDVVKAAALCKGLPSGRRMVVGAVMADRIVGVYALFALAALGVIVGRISGHLSDLPAVLLAVPLLVVVGLPVALLLGRLAGRWLSTLIPARLTERVEPILASLRALAESPRILVGSTLLGVTSHALAVVTYVVAGEVLGVSLRLLDHCLLDPLALTLNTVPFSPGGLGLSEGAFSYLYDLIGVSQGAAIGVLGRVVQYTVYVLTGLIALILPDDAPATEESP